MKKYIIPIIGAMLLGGCSTVEVPHIKKNTITRVETEYSKSLQNYANFTGELFSELKKRSTSAQFGVFSQQSLSNDDCKDVSQFTKYSNSSNDDKLVDSVCLNYENNSSNILTSKRFFLVSNIQNKTQNKDLPNDIRFFLTSAINNLNQDYSVVSAKSDSVFHAQREHRGNYRIIGGITGYDNLYTKSESKYIDVYGGKGKGESDASFDNSNDREVTEITLDLVLESYDSVKGLWTYVPFRNVSNTIYIVKDKKSGGVNISVTGLSLNFSETVNFGAGLHHALRLLSEKSLLDLFGKMDDLPYWSFYPVKYLEQYTTECIAKVEMLNEFRKESDYYKLRYKKNKSKEEKSILKSVETLSKKVADCKNKIRNHRTLVDKNWNRTLNDKIWKNRQPESLEARKKALLNILYDGKGTTATQLESFFRKHKGMRKVYITHPHRFLVKLFEYTILKRYNNEVLLTNKDRIKRLFQ